MYQPSPTVMFLNSPSNEIPTCDEQLLKTGELVTEINNM
jgi:hypothetical protein